VHLAKIMGNANAKEPMDFVDALVELQKECGVYHLKMSEYGIEREELEIFVKEARETMGGLFEVDPAPLLDEDCLEIYENSYR
ncbi:MAG: alcohol dehydrogenase, partial [Lachnospiraceae bacterium]